MKRIVGVALTIMAGLQPAVLSAESEEHAMTGGDLQQMCVAQDDANKTGCRLYILGVTQGITAGMNIADGKTIGGRPCIPDNISGQALEPVVKMKLGADLTVFPADRKEDASGLIAGVIVSSFACSKAKH